LFVSGVLLFRQLATRLFLASAVIGLYVNTVDGLVWFSLVWFSLVWFSLVWPARMVS